MVTNFALACLCWRWASLITDNTTSAHCVCDQVCVTCGGWGPTGGRAGARQCEGECGTVLCNATQVATVLHCTHQPAAGTRVKPGFGSCRVMHWCHAPHDSRHRVTRV